MEWLALVLLLIVIAAAVWFLLRRPSGAGDGTDRTRTTDTAAPTHHDEPGAGTAGATGLAASETGHGAPGGGTAGVVGAGAGDSSAGHGSPGAHTGEIGQAEGYGAPGPDTAATTGAGSAGPEGAGAGYGTERDLPYDQSADDAAYGRTAEQAAYGEHATTGYDDATAYDETRTAAPGYETDQAYDAPAATGYGDAATGGQEQVQPAATGEHWTPSGAESGDYRAATDEGYTTDQGHTTDEGYTSAEPADGSYETPVDRDVNPEVANDVPPAAYAGDGTATSEPYAAEPTFTEPASEPVSGSDEQQWQDTHAGEPYAGAMDDTSTEPVVEPVSASYSDDEPVAEPYGAEPVEPVSAADEPWQDPHAGEPYAGAMDDTTTPAPEPVVEQAPEETRTFEQPGGSYDQQADEQTRAYEQPTLTEGQPEAGSAASDTAAAQDAGDFGYDEAHFGAASSGGFAPGPYGPGSAVPAEDGSGPAGWTIKGNAGSMLFHTPDSPSYEHTTAEVWFESEEAARAAGFAHWDRKRR